MHFKFIFFVFAILPFLGYGQNFYHTTIYDSLEEDADYLPIRQKLDSLNQEINQLFGKAEFTIVEQILLKDLLFFVEEGHDSLVVKQLDKAEVQELFKKNEIDQKRLVELTRFTKPLLEYEKSIKMIYLVKERLTTISAKKLSYLRGLEVKNELSKYKLKNNQQIMEIRAGDISFSKELSKKSKEF